MQPGEPLPRPSRGVMAAGLPGCIQELAVQGPPAARQEGLAECHPPQRCWPPVSMAVSLRCDHSLCPPRRWLDMMRKTRRWRTGPPKQEMSRPRAYPRGSLQEVDALPGIEPSADRIARGNAGSPRGCWSRTHLSSLFRSRATIPVDELRQGKSRRFSGWLAPARIGLCVTLRNPPVVSLNRRGRRGTRKTQLNQPCRAPAHGCRKTPSEQRPGRVEREYAPSPCCPIFGRNQSRAPPRVRNT